MRFFVAGKPISQGSMTVYNGYAVHGSDAKLKAWRETVAWTAKRYFPKPLEGRVSIVATFILEKPKSVKRDTPHVKPDLDKLVRAIGDALTGIAFKDDSQVTALFARKDYGDTQGVVLDIRQGNLVFDWEFPEADSEGTIIERGGNA